MTNQSDRKDGWHQCDAYDVWVENGRVTRGTDNNIRPVYPYRSTPEGWVRENPTLQTLRRGLRSGKWRML